MASVVGRTVTDFKSLEYGEYNTSNHASSVRRRLDTPRLLLNMMHTADGSLWMPPAFLPLTTGSPLSTPGDDDNATKRLIHIPSPQFALMVQKGRRLHFWLQNPPLPYGAPDATYDLLTDEKVWAAAYDDFTLIGNSDQTIKVASALTITDISASVPEGYHSITYLGRRFVVERVFGTSGVDERVWFSAIGDPESFPNFPSGDPPYFLVGADTQGDSWDSSLGSPVRVEPFGDVLMLFHTQRIQRFTGTDPLTNFTIRNAPAQQGVWMRDSVKQVEQGIIFFGGTPRGEFGFYLFGGAGVRLLSMGLDGYLRRWDENSYAGTTGQQFDADLMECVGWRDQYIAAFDNLNDDPTLFVLDLRQNKWSVFDGWDRPTIGTVRIGADYLVIGDAQSDDLFYTDNPMARATATTPARFVVGYEDEEQPSGLVRYLEARITVNAKVAAGSSGITFGFTANIEPTGSTVSDSELITASGQTTLCFPIKLRGSRIELDCTVTPSVALDELLIENVELVQARKNLKVARCGPRTTAFVVPTPGSLTVRGWTEGEDTGEVLSGTAVTHASTVEGDQMVLIIEATNFEDNIPVIADVAGWTLVASNGYTGSVALSSSGHAFKVFVRTATAADAAGAGSYPVSSSTAQPTIADHLRWAVGSYIVPGYTPLYGSSVTDDTQANTTAVAAVAALEQPSLLIGAAYNTSDSGSRDINLTILPPALFSSTFAADTAFDVGLAIVAAGGVPSTQADEVNVTDALAVAVVVAVPLTLG